MKKRLICALLSILMLVSLLPMGALATSGTSEKGDDSVASVTIDGTTTYYTSVASAVAAIESSGTLAILQECDTAITVASNVTITLDLQTDYHGNITIESGGTLIFDSTYSMMGGKVTVSGSLFVRNSGVGSVTLNSGATMEVTGGSAGGGGSVTVNEGAMLTVSGGSVNKLTVAGGTVNVIGGSLMDTATLSSGTLNINGTVSGSVPTFTVAGGTLNVNSGILATSTLTISGGTVNVSGGTLTSAEPIVIKDSGNLTVTNGNVTGDTDTDPVIKVDSSATGSITISGGSVKNTSDFNKTVLSNSSESATIEITGGTFSSNVSTYTSGTVTENTDGTFTVTTATTTYVAQNTSTGNKYETLAEAISNASSGEEIKLLDDVTEDVTINSDGSIAIDLNGKTLTGDITVNGGTLTIKDSTAEENVAGSGGTVKGNITATDGKLTIEAGYYTGTLTGNSECATITFGTFASKITAAETVLGYIDSGCYHYYQNPDGSYTYTKDPYYEYVTIGDTTTYYKDFSSALTAANVVEQTATITALNNSAACLDTEINITSGIEVLGNLTIDFNKCATISTSVETDYILKVGSGASLKLLNNETSALGNSSATSTSNGGIGVLVNGGTLTVGDYASIKGYYGIKVTDNGTVNVSGTEAAVTGTDRAIYVENGTVNVSNSGTVSGASYGIYLDGSDCELNISDGTVKSTGTGSTAVHSDGATVNVSGGSIDGKYYGVYAAASSTVNITSGTTSSGSTTNSAALYATDGTTVNMSGGTLEGGYYGLYVNGTTGSATITGSVEIEGKTYAIYVKDGIATITDVDAGSSEIGRTDNYCIYSDGGTVTVDSGWYTGSTTACVGATNGGTVSISGGSYSSNVTEYCVSGYVTTADEDGNYTVTQLKLGIYSETGDVPVTTIVNYGGSTIYVGVSGTDMSKYYSNEKYPTTDLTYTPSGVDSGKYIFAGWYFGTEAEDGTMTYTACDSSMWTDNSGTDYYAKFVDANVLTVKVQVLEDAATASSTSMRLISTVDTLQYGSVGFEVTIGTTNQPITVTSSTVYKQIEAADGMVTIDYEPTAICSLSQYFITCSLINIPGRGYGTNIKITPIWTTLDGTTVYGTTRTVTVNQVIQNGSSSNS